MKKISIGAIIAIANIGACFVSLPASADASDSYPLSGVYRIESTGSPCGYNTGSLKIEANADQVLLSVYNSIEAEGPVGYMAIGPAYANGSVTVPPIAPGASTVQTIGTYSADKSSFHYIYIQDGVVSAQLDIASDGSKIKMVKSYGATSSTCVLSL